MKKIFLFVALAATLSSCYKDRITGDGPIVSTNRNVSSFTGIDLRIGADVNYTVSSNRTVEIKAQQNIIDVIETDIIDGKLVIRYENNVNVRSHENIIINVTGPALDRLRISGSGNISTTGDMNASSLEMDISGSGDIHVSQVHTGLIDADISGSGSINLVNGVGTDERLKISGSGNIDLEGVDAQTANTNTSGSGDIRLQASKTLDVKISGSGSVFYKGNPVVNTSISGSGKVKHI